MSYIMFSFPVSALFEMSEGEQNQFDKKKQKNSPLEKLLCVLSSWLGIPKNAYSLNTVAKAIGLAKNISSGSFSERIDEINFHT